MPCLALFLALLFLLEAEGHGRLSHPPPRTGTNANVRTSPCGGSVQSPAVTFWVGEPTTLTFNIEGNHGGYAEYQLVQSPDDEIETNFRANNIISNITVAGKGTGEFQNNHTWTKECAHCILRWHWVSNEATPYYGCSDISVLIPELSNVTIKVWVGGETVPTPSDLSLTLQAALDSSDIPASVGGIRTDSFTCTRLGVTPCNIFFVDINLEKYVANDQIVTAAAQRNAWQTSVPQSVSTLLATNNITATPAAASGADAGDTGAGGKTSDSNSIAAGIMIPVAFLVAAAIAYLLFRPLLTTLGTNWTISNEKMHYFLWSWVFAWFVIFLLDAVSVASTKWSYLGSWEMGLWKSCVNGSCQDNTDIDFPRKSNVDATRAFMILAVLTSVAGFGGTLAAALGRAPHRTVAFASYVGGIVMFCLNFMAMSIYGAWNNDYLSKNISGVKYGYGFGLTILVWVMSICMAMFSFFLFIKFGLNTPEETPKEAAATPAATAEAETPQEAAPEEETQQV